ncbi:MAG: 50S ribosomal protein L20 [Candidatus Obscuribacterales bacterium]|nr:50S ribosomal protein L20 [Candidatus Obscuribacterales bacterium]
MAKVKRGNVLKNRHKKILKYAKGFRGSNSKLFIAANQTLMKAWRNAYRDRRKRKRVFRRLWITRINAACRSHGLPYNRLINGLAKANVEVNRKLLAELAVNDKAAFAKLVDIAKEKVK